MRRRRSSTRRARSSARRRTTRPPTRPPRQSSTVSVANNLPNADAGANPAGSQEQRSEETTNYEIGKTVRTIVREQPLIRRISLAVMVDQVAVKGTDGPATWQDRTPDELGRIAALARSAIGYDEKRGDRVEVVSLRFAEADVAVEPVSAGVPGPAAGQGGPDPAGSNRGARSRCPAGATAGVAADGAAADDRIRRPLADGCGQHWPGPRRGAASGRLGARRHAGPDRPETRRAADESMVRIGNIEGAVRASSLRTCGRPGGAAP